MTCKQTLGVTDRSINNVGGAGQNVVVALKAVVEGSLPTSAFFGTFGTSVAAMRRPERDPTASDQGDVTASCA